MPVRRRVAKQRPRYPDAIERLIRGEPIEPTEENRQTMITLAYFGWAEYPELGDAMERRAFDQLRAWDGD